MEVGLTSSNVQFPTKVEARVTEILNRILGTPVELQAQLLQYFIDVQSTISYRTKIDHHNYMKILDLGINKCVYRTKLLRFTSKNPIASMLPAKIELHEFEVDGGMSWKTLEEKWLSKFEEHEGFYLSKEVTIVFKYFQYIYILKFFGLFQFQGVLWKKRRYTYPKNPNCR